MFELLLFTVFFILYSSLWSDYQKRHRVEPQPSQALPTPQPEVDPQPQPQPSQALEVVAPTVTLSIEVDPQPQPSQTLPSTVKELRKLASEKGIPWRNYHGKNRHMNKGELLQALSL